MEVLGFTEEMTECSMCGRTELKGTYAIESDGVTHYLGSSCVKKKYMLTQKEFTTKKNETVQKRRNERYLFTKEVDENYSKLSKKYPNACKYNPEADGYTYVMEAIKKLNEKRKECDEKLPIIYKML
jgi:hypothetical protein